MSIREIIFTPGAPLVVAHRGASGICPENTMAALRAALRAKADMIEIDVQLARGGEVVVFHDATLARTTDGAGYIRNKTLAELQALDAGSWFGGAFSGEKIPTLDEALEEIARHAFINIEIKPEAVRARSASSIETILVKKITEHSLETSVLFSSFHPLALRRIKKLLPGVATAVIQLPFLRRIPPSVLAQKAGKAEVYVCSLAEANARRIDEAHRAGLRVSVYTVNSIEEYTRMADLGADAIVTNVPEKFTEVSTHPLEPTR